MDARLNLFGSPVSGALVKHMNAAAKALSDSALPRSTQELVKLRASQINGCAFCTDMHTKDAAQAGETSVRLNLSRPGGRPRSSLRPNGPPWN